MIETWTKEYEDELVAEEPSVNERLKPADFLEQARQVQSLGVQFFANFIDNVVFGKELQIVK